MPVCLTPCGRKKEEQFSALEHPIEFLIFRFPVAGYISFYLRLFSPVSLSLSLISFFLFQAFSILRQKTQEIITRTGDRTGWGNFNYPEILDTRTSHIRGYIFLKGGLEAREGRYPRTCTFLSPGFFVPLACKLHRLFFLIGPRFLAVELIAAHGRCFVSAAESKFVKYLVLAAAASLQHPRNARTHEARPSVFFLFFFFFAAAVPRIKMLDQGALHGKIPLATLHRNH